MTSTILTPTAVTREALAILRLEPDGTLLDLPF